ncbi:protein kinase domain-containing protein [Actinomadura xylanilytica]|uniref:protein kinase domain-containing protein n=1 Tax=Actinomadura xylanilytica TaxID=887459 RepID=UPI00255AF9CA|nr:protein kinase [Actinomadura xylanilytica]MDL4777722.1 protein kinase [Actinomadura xylanilytica]
MAELTVMGDYQGPGERKTAESLARDLPGSWHVIAGRKLSGPRRDDLDLVVVGDHALFVLDEKAWGPRIELGDQFWRVKREERRNPLDRANHLARVLAGQLRARVSGYGSKVRGRPVIAGIVLSHDNVELVVGPTYADGDAVVKLAGAAAWLRRQDEACGVGLQAVRDETIAFLLGLPERELKPERIGPYQVVGEIEPIETARCFHAKDGDRTVILRCYPMHGWGPDASPQAIMKRERLALDRLEERDRAWQIHPSFEYEARQWIVVPVVPAHGKNLAGSVRIDDPAREDGRLPQQVAIDVVTDAFRGLAEVHEVGLVHRGLYPRRIFFGRGLRVKFSDFYLARVEGERTIAPQMSADADPGVPYRAPECRDGIAYATPASDVYSLALALSGWVLGDLAAEPQVEAVREAIVRTPVIGPLLADCLADDPRERPEAATAVTRIGQVIEAMNKERVAVGKTDAAEEFRVGGVVADRYEIKESLGQGGFAHTWRAWDTSAEADRVIKQFHDDAAASHAQQEYKAADRIRHDHCARVYDISREKPGYLVLEYIPGDNLRGFAAAASPDAQRYRTIALDVLSALAHLHDRNLVHRDVTPTNVIVTPEARAKLIDFGVAGRPQATTVVGTPPFMAPELRAAQGATAQSDLYGFAVTMIYTMLGRYPYAGDPARGDDDRERLLPPTDDERRAWGRLGAAMLEVLYSAVRTDPAERPASANELAAQLQLLDEIVEPQGELLVNPVVDHLRGLYRASSVGNSGNRGLDDDFAHRTYVPTLLDTELLPAIARGELRLVLLTGNPGDGKTSFLVKISEQLHQDGAQVISENAAGWRMNLDGHTFVAVYDASESHDGKSSDDLMREALDPGPDEDPQRRTVLLAINDGRLLQFFTDHEDIYDDDAREVLGQMSGKPTGDETIALVDLKRRTLARRPGDAPSLAGRILDSFTDPEHWKPCEGCLSREVCPMVRNATELRGPARPAVEELVATSHLRRQRRATFRDVRSALAWLITGDRSCDGVHRARERGMDLRRAGDALVEDLAFDPRSADYLVREWADLDPANTAAPDAERAARADRSVADDPTAFGDRDRERVQRRLFFGLWNSGGLRRETVRVYRHLGGFEEALLGSGERLEETRGRVLRGLSRLLGAPGYRGDDLAVADQGAGGTWAVLKEIPAAEFSLERVEHSSPYVEWRPDALWLDHVEGHSLILTLDTFELVIRAADGELIGDSAADSVRQEIETFAAALRRSPANAVSIVNPAGTARSVKVVDQRIVLERA